jgi:hypothetical protein
MMPMSEQGAAMNAALQRCTTTFQVTVFWKSFKEVVFLEAGKDFVDTLLSFLLLPVGTINHIVSQLEGKEADAEIFFEISPLYCSWRFYRTKGCMSFNVCCGHFSIQGRKQGCLGGDKPLRGISSIFESVDFLTLHVDKQDLVQRRPSAPECTACRSKSCSSVPVLRDLEAAGILRPERQVLSQSYFKCASQECSRFSSEKGERCEACKSGGCVSYFCDGPYSVQMKDPYLKEVSHSKSGFVEETSTKFIITDELEIRPSTTMTMMNALKKLNLSPSDDLKSSEIAVSISQVLNISESFNYIVCVV